MVTPSLLSPIEEVRILMLEDSQRDADLCVETLKGAGLSVEVEVARCARVFMEKVSSRPYELIIASYRIADWTGMDAFEWLRAPGGGNGLDTFEWLREPARDTPFVLLADTFDTRLALECVEAGVCDYVSKEDLRRLPIALRRALQEQKLRRARHRAQNELRESEEQYRLMFEANPHPMWVFDSTTLRFLTVNQAAIHHYGYSREEFLSMTVKDIRPAEDVDRLLKSVHTGETYNALWRHTKKDGSMIDVEISSQPIIFRGIGAQLVLAHDVTVQRRTEARIRESQEQLQLLLDSTVEGILATDLTGTCVLCNAAAVRLLGYNHESEVIGKNTHALMHHTRPNGESYATAECAICEPLRAGNPAHVHSEVLWRADGSSFPAEYWTYPIKQEGRLVGSVMTFFDITERKKAGQQLRRSESRYRSMVENAPYGIIRVDQSGRIAMANPAFAAMLGYENPKDVVGLITTSLYLNPIEQRKARDYAFEDAGLGYDVQWKRKDGRTITVRLGGRRLPEDDELPGGYEVFVEDVTETRLLQRQFEHAQRMQAIGRLAAGVAHDFNNLLMVITSYVHLMQNGKRNSGNLSHYLSQIQGASARAAGITRQLLAFSRKQAMEPAILDLNLIVKDLGNMLPRLLGEDVEMVLSLDPHLGTLRADRGQIEQVVMNLAVNAKDAMPKGGRITIETANVNLDVLYHKRREIRVPPGRYVMLAITDTGQGMDPETQTHIFEPFFTTKEEGKGTGLGLATVYGIVKQNLGFIWVYSEIGKGSTLKVYLPRLDVAAPKASSETLQITPGGNETILLAEDEAALRAVSRIYLESKGYTVLEAPSGQEALKLCREYPKPIDVLITDLVMPAMGGLELAKAAVDFRPELAIVFVSGYPDRPLDREAAHIGAKLLQKPFSLDSLARTVRLLLSKNRTILLIDDSHFVRVAAERLLSAAGYKVNVASDGEEGVRIARETRPDAVLLDMILPKTPGREVLRRLKSDPDTKDIPVIVVTALSGRNRKRVLAEGASAYLEKSDKLLADDGAALIGVVCRVLKRTMSNQ